MVLSLSLALSHSVSVTLCTCQPNGQGPFPSPPPLSSDPISYSYSMGISLPLPSFPLPTAHIPGVQSYLSLSLSLSLSNTCTDACPIKSLVSLSGSFFPHNTYSFPNRSILASPVSLWFLSPEAFHPTQHTPPPSLPPPFTLSFSPTSLSPLWLLWYEIFLPFFSALPTHCSIGDWQRIAVMHSKILAYCKWTIHW
jgi:hypothetical protein